MDEYTEGSVSMGMCGLATESTARQTSRGSLRRHGGGNFCNDSRYGVTGLGIFVSAAVHACTRSETDVFGDFRPSRGPKQPILLPCGATRHPLLPAAWLVTAARGLEFLFPLPCRLARRPRQVLPSSRWPHGLAYQNNDKHDSGTMARPQKGDLMSIALLSPRLSTAEVSAVAQVMSSLYAEHPVADDTVLATLMAEMNGLSANLAAAIGRQADTSQLKLSVGQLDKACRSFHSLLKHYVQSSDATMSAGAKQLMVVLAAHGGLGMLHYGSLAKLGKVKALLTELDEPASASLIAQLPHAAESVADVRQRCTDLTSCLATLSGNQSAQTDQQPAYLIKKQVVELLNKRIVVYVNGKLIEDAEAYATFAAAANALIARGNSRVYATKKGDDETSGSVTATTEPQVGIAG